MALSFTANPNQKTTAYRPVVYTVQSDDANCVRVIADINIGASYKVSLEKSPNIGTTDTFSFDISNILQDYLSAIVPDFLDSTHLLVDDTASSLDYDVIFFEVIDNGTTFDTSWAEGGAGSPSSLSSTSLNTDHYAYAMTFKHEETNDITVYQKGGTYGSVSRGHLPNTTFDGKTCDIAKKIKRGDFLVTNCYSTGGGNHFGRYITYDSNGTQLSSNDSNLASFSNFRGTYYIDTSIVESNAAKILSIVILVSSGQTQYLNYDIVEDCNDYVSLYWQNFAGGMDYYLFRDGNIKNTSGTSEIYTQPLTTSYNEYDFGQTVLKKDNQISRRVISEVISRQDANWLSELMTHGNRAWIYEGGAFVPVIIADGDIVSLNTADGAYRVELELVYSNKQITQRF